MVIQQQALLERLYQRAKLAAPEEPYNIDNPLLNIYL